MVRGSVIAFVITFSSVVMAQDHESILGNLDSLNPKTSDSIVAHVAPDVLPPGSVVTSYKGIQLVITRRASGYYRRLVSETMDRLWSGTNLAIMDIERLSTRLNEQQADIDNGGRWWERNWTWSMVQEAGGAPVIPFISRIGKEVEVIRLFDISFTTEGKLRLGPLSVVFDDEVQEIPRFRSKPPEGRLNASLFLFEHDAVSEISYVSGSKRSPRIPRGGIYTGDFWNLSIKPNIQLRLPRHNDYASCVSSLSLDSSSRIYYGYSSRLLFIISVKIKLAPAEMILSLSGDIEVFIW